MLAADQALELLAQLEQSAGRRSSAVMAALRRPSRDLAREFSRALERAITADQARWRLRPRGL